MASRPVTARQTIYPGDSGRGARNAAIAAAIQAPGAHTSEGFEHRVTVGRWDTERPYVLFQSFSGGAHCCNQVQVVHPENGRLRLVDLGEWDGDYWDELPTDRNVPASPSMVSRFAPSKTYFPATGVRAGRATFHGPNVPEVSISPFGTGFVNVAIYGIVWLMPSRSMVR